MGRTRVASAIGLALLMALSTIGAPATAQATAQDPKQPSPDNPHMHFWGTSDLSSCWTHFDGNDSSGSSNDGFGESTVSSGRHTVDFDCRMQDTFKQDMYLDNNGTIQLEFTVDVYAPGTCDGAQNDCEELNVTILQGTKVIAKEQFNGVDSGDPDSRVWQIDVDQNMTRWNRSAEEPIVNFRWVGYADSGLHCFIIQCQSDFKFYYSNNGNESVEMNFPVVNMTVPGEVGEEEEGGLIGGVTDSLPGFGLMAGVGSLAMAAVAASRLSREE